MFKNILFIGFIALLLNGCFGKKQEEKWTAFIYPDKTDSKNISKALLHLLHLKSVKKYLF